MALRQKRTGPWHSNTRVTSAARDRAAAVAAGTFAREAAVAVEPEPATADGGKEALGPDVDQAEKMSAIAPIALAMGHGPVVLAIDRGHGRPATARTWAGAIAQAIDPVGTIVREIGIGRGIDAAGMVPVGVGQVGIVGRIVVGPAARGCLATIGQRRRSGSAISLCSV